MNTVEATAFHQAGHAVAALFHQLSFEQITLAAEGRLGESFLEQYTLAGWESQSREQREAAFIVILAGEMAERKAAGRRRRRMGLETGWVMHVLGTLEGSESIARAYYRYLSLKTQALLDHPYVWETAEKIACRLLETPTLDFIQLKCIWHKADPATGKYLAGESANLSSRARLLV